MAIGNNESVVADDSTTNLQENINPDTENDIDDDTGNDSDTVSLNTEENQQQTRQEELEEKISEYKDKWLRSVAELENVRRISAKEKEDALKYGKVNFAKDMLEIADNIERAIQSAEENGSDNKSIIEGLKITNQQIISIFKRNDIQKVETEDKIFDHNYHQAISEIEDNEKPNGSIAFVHLAGYTINERLLRPAMVVTTKQTSKN